MISDSIGEEERGVIFESSGLLDAFESCAYVGVPSTVDAVYLKLACAQRPRYVHRVVVVRGHVQDRADIVQIAFRHRAATAGDKRLQ